jgi:hypothetical protein
MIIDVCFLIIQAAYLRRPLSMSVSSQNRVPPDGAILVDVYDSLPNLKYWSNRLKDLALKEK